MLIHTIGIEGQWYPNTEKWAYFVWCRTSPTRGYKKYFLQKTFFSCEEAQNIVIMYQNTVMIENDWLLASS